MSVQQPLPKDPPPAFRRLRVFALDPVLAANVETVAVSTVELKIRWGDLQGPGPVGEYLDVVDFDPTQNCFYAPVDLHQRSLIADAGLAPSESDPRFHQQMVYAVAMYTIQTFESALGRRVLWSERADVHEPVERLRVYPHALVEENAYYDPERKALLFGYFRTDSSAKAASAPGTYVFTALSFDIISHETTHAILDGMHRRLIEDTNPDSLAFHEAFSDIVALLQHFSLPEFLRFQIASTRGALETDNLLAKLATQFGQGIGKYGALRDAIGIMEPDLTGRYAIDLRLPNQTVTGEIRSAGDTEDRIAWRRVTPRERNLNDLTEAHERGSILVSAVFDAFLAIYKKRTADLVRIASDGTGILRPGSIPPDLVARLADDAAMVARQVLQMCIRAIDYLPPVDITFGEYLRAIITADYDVIRDDKLAYRVAFIQAFQKWGIFPHDVPNLGEQSLLWQSLGGLVDERVLTEHLQRWFANFDHTIRSQMAKFRFSMPRRDVRTWSRSTAYLVHEAIEALFLQNSGPIDRPGLLFGVEPTSSGKIEVHSARPLQRMPVDASSRPSTDLVIVMTQSVWIDRETLQEIAPADLAQTDRTRRFRFRGGASIIYDIDQGRFKYVVRKSVRSQSRIAAQIDYQSSSRRSLYFDETPQPFRMLHNPGATA